MRIEISNELVSHTSEHSLHLAEFAKSNEMLADPVLRRDFFEHMDENDFLDYVQQIASLVRTGDSESRQHFDGLSVGLLGHEVPDHREKEDLLRETWHTARTFLLDRTLTDEDALEYAALTVAGGILYTHPFADGNGRTSRVTSYLLSQGSNNPQALDEIVSESMSKKWQIAPVGRLAVDHKSDFKGPQPDSIDWEFQFAGETEDAIGGSITGSIYSTEILREFIERHGNDFEDIIKACTKTDEEGKTQLDGDEFLNKIVNDEKGGVINAQELLRIRRELQADYVHRYLESMTSNREMPLYKSIASSLEHRPTDIESILTTQAAMRREFAKRAIAGTLNYRDQQATIHRAHSSLHTLIKYQAPTDSSRAA